MAARGAAGLAAQQGRVYEDRDTYLDPMAPRDIRERMNREGGTEWIKSELNYIRMCKEPIQEQRQEKNDKRQAEKTCRERAPYFELNGTTPFSDFLVSFESAIAPELEMLDNQAIHRLLYFCTGPDARRLLGEANVPEKHTRMNAREYYNLVQEVFEPAAESEGIRLEFLTRMQAVNEQPQRYYKDKRNLFERSFKKDLRDYRFFFGEIIKGLTNMAMKDKLRYEVPDQCSAKDEPLFYQKVMHMANVLRTKRIAGEISEAECIGAEATQQNYSIQASYPGPRNQDHGGYQFKPEPVLAINDKTNGNQPMSKACYYCMRPGHFIAQCPRKAGGLPAVNMVGGSGGYPPVNTVSPVNAVDRYGNCYYAEGESVNALQDDPLDLGYPEAYLGGQDPSVNALPYRGNYRGQRGAFRGRVGQGVYRPAPAPGYPARTLGYNAPRLPNPLGYANKEGTPRTPYKKFHSPGNAYRAPPTQRVAYLQQDKAGNEYWREKTTDLTPPAAHVAHVDEGAGAPPEEEGVHVLHPQAEGDYEYMQPQPFLGL